jgi:hypothetical protein
LGEITLRKTLDLDIFLGSVPVNFGPWPKYLQLTVQNQPIFGLFRKILGKSWGKLPSCDRNESKHLAKNTQRVHAVLCQCLGTRYRPTLQWSTYTHKISQFLGVFLKFCENCGGNYPQKNIESRHFPRERSCKFSLPRYRRNVLLADDVIMPRPQPRNEPRHLAKSTQHVHALL